MTGSAHLPEIYSSTTIVKILQKWKSPFTFVVNSYNTEISALFGVFLLYFKLRYKGFLVFDSSNIFP